MLTLARESLGEYYNNIRRVFMSSFAVRGNNEEMNEEEEFDREEDEEWRERESEEIEVKNVSKILINDLFSREIEIWREM